jgi:hypothetical protein
VCIHAQGRLSIALSPGIRHESVAQWMSVVLGVIYSYNQYD